MCVLSLSSSHLCLKISYYNRMCVELVPPSVCSPSVGSFVVVNYDNLEITEEHNHRKEELSDIKFAPSESSFLFPMALGLSK